MILTFWNSEVTYEWFIHGLKLTVGKGFFLPLQYYYNSETGQYLYWDAEQSTYLQAPAGTMEEHAAADGQKTDKKDGKDKKEKVKVAKKIAKVNSCKYSVII